MTTCGESGCIYYVVWLVDDNDTPVSTDVYTTLNKQLCLSQQAGWMWTHRHGRVWAVVCAVVTEQVDENKVSIEDYTNSTNKLNNTCTHIYTMTTASTRPWL